MTEAKGDGLGDDGLGRRDLWDTEGVPGREGLPCPENSPVALKGFWQIFLMKVKIQLSKEHSSGWELGSAVEHLPNLSKALGFSLSISKKTPKTWLQWLTPIILLKRLRIGGSQFEASLGK
jgi:hypothetical protein